jgi:hypothetical protein
MFEQFNYNLRNNWSFMRIIRVLMGVYGLVQAWQTSQILIGIIGALLFVQGIMNWGCCGVQSCAPTKKGTPEKEVEFEEVK